jgi:predicted aspartyl protease
MLKMMKKLFLMISVVLTFSYPTAAQKSAVVDIPMTFNGTRPVVEVMVNGKGPFLFLIDTGAQGQARADVSLVQRLGLPSTGQSASTDDTGKNAVNLNAVRMDTLSIGNISFREVTALSRNYNSSSYLPDIDGILGFNLFSDYLLTLDYPNKRVRIERGELPKADGAQILNFEKREGDTFGDPLIEISVGSLKAKALIDTGNIFGITLPTALVKKLSLASYKTAVGKAKTVSNEFEISEVRLQDTISIGRHLFPEPTIIFADVFDDVIIGSTDLKEFAVTFDQKNHRVRFVKKQKIRAKK